MMFQPPHPCCEKVELVPGGHDLEVTEENKAAPEVGEFPWIFEWIKANGAAWDQMNTRYKYFNTSISWRLFLCLDTSLVEAQNV